MSRIFTLFVFTFLLIQNQNIAQTPCGGGGDEPFTACLMCGSNLIGNTGGYSTDIANYNFPCGTIDNSQWIAFEANASNIQIDLISGNCQNSNGIEAAVYSQQLQLVSNCFSSNGINMNGTLNAGGLSVGAVYYLMIDGFNGDICNFSATITGSKTYGLPLPPGPVARSGPTELCPGAQSTYEIAPVSNATDYFWTVPQAGKIVGGQGTRRIFVEWEIPGGGVVRVTPSNRCYTGLSSFVVESVLAIPPVLRAPEFVCPGDFPVTRDGIDFTDFGSETVTLTSATGCDSIVTYSFMPKPSIPLVIDTTICPGECVQVGDSCYAEAGNFRIVADIPQANGCDSIIMLNINILQGVSVNNHPDTLFCIDTCTNVTPDITFSGQNITAEWNTLTGNISTSSGLSVTICSGGDYFLSLTDTLSGESCSLETHVTGDTIGLDSLKQIAVAGGMCASDTFLFSTDLLPTANGYDWQLPGSATVLGSSLGSSVQVIFDNVFSGDICVRAYNTCDTSNLLCTNIATISAPSSDFDAFPFGCTRENFGVTYTGGAGSSAVFNWSFDNADIVSGSGAGPYEIEFPTTGDYEISLQVTENGCISAVTSQSVTVTFPLDTPMISCIADTGSIIFSWADDPRVSSYNAVSIASPQGNLNGRTEYAVTGLNLGDEVTMELQAVGALGCPQVVSRLTCQTQNCPNISIDIPSVSYCENSTTPPSMIANITGGSGNGTFEWTSQNIMTSGAIPTGLAPANYPVAVTYTEGGCDFTGSGSYTVLSVPEIEADVQSPIWEPGTKGNIDLSVLNGSTGNNFNWSDGTDTEDLTGVQPGNYCVTVTNSVGCTVDDCYTISTGIYFTQPVEIICSGIGKTLTVTPDTGADFIWSPATGLSCADCPSPFANPSQSTIYTVTATLPSGQSESKTVQTIVLPQVICPQTRNTISEQLLEAILEDNVLSLAEKEEQITDFIIENSVRIFPNPSSGKINIESDFEVLSIDITDATGKHLLSEKNSNLLNISAFPKGTYFLKITMNERVIVKRILKK